jgi:hypothetical protein
MKNPLKAPGNEYEIHNEIPRLNNEKCIESARE